MTKKTITFNQLTLPFEVQKDTWDLRMAKSETRLNRKEQLRILTEADTAFVPVSVEEDEDTFYFSFQVDTNKKKWQDIMKLARNEKLRLLCNTAELNQYIPTRLTFFLHPENVVYDDNLMPAVIYRGIRGLMPPYELNEKEFYKQMQCFAIALFTKKYTYDELYNGSLKNAQDTEFERAVNETENLQQLIAFLQSSYESEQKKTEREMQIVPVKRFRLFRILAGVMISISILLAIPLGYLAFVKQPLQEKLLAAHGHYLASNYNEVITALDGVKPEDLPNDTKYILATSYIQGENLSDEEKQIVMKNVSLKSETDYLLYWIYNGRGAFDESIDKAKFLDDPRLVMYGLIKKIEQTKSNPDLEGEERDDQLAQLTSELEQYREQYVETDEEEEEETRTEEVIDTEVGSEETNADVEETHVEEPQNEETNDPTENQANNDGEGNEEE